MGPQTAVKVARIPLGHLPCGGHHGDTNRHRPGTRKAQVAPVSVLAAAVLWPGCWLPRCCRRAAAGHGSAQVYDEATQKQTRTSLGGFDALPSHARFDAARREAEALATHLQRGGSVDVFTVRQACTTSSSTWNQKVGPARPRQPVRGSVCWSTRRSWPALICASSRRTMSTSGART